MRKHRVRHQKHKKKKKHRKGMQSCLRDEVEIIGSRYKQYCILLLKRYIIGAAEVKRREGLELGGEVE